MSLMFEDPQKYLEVTSEMQKQDNETLSNTLAKIRAMTDEEWTAKLALLGDLLCDIRVASGQTLRSFKLGVTDNLEFSEISRAERGLALPSDELIKSYIKTVELIPKDF